MRESIKEFERYLKHRYPNSLLEHMFYYRRKPRVCQSEDVNNVFWRIRVHSRHRHGDCLRRVGLRHTRPGMLAFRPTLGGGCRPDQAQGSPTDDRPRHL